MTREHFERDKRYLTAVAVANDMLRCCLIDECDYSALETKFAALFRPLIRYEKPCLFGTLPIRQTDEGGVDNGPYYTKTEPDAAAAAAPSECRGICACFDGKGNDAPFPIGAGELLQREDPEASRLALRGCIRRRGIDWHEGEPARISATSDGLPGRVDRNQMSVYDTRVQWVHLWVQMHPLI